MASELTQIMSFLDRNCANFKEGEYLDMCNLLMSLHKKLTKPVIDPVAFAAIQPLPPVPVQVPFLPATGRVFAPVSFVEMADTAEREIVSRFEKIRVLKTKLWGRMSEGRKKKVMIDLLGQGSDWTCLFELERAFLEKRGLLRENVVENNVFLSHQYKLAFRRHNNEIHREIKVHTDAIDRL